MLVCFSGLLGVQISLQIFTYIYMGIESIECFVEGKALSRSYDLAPRPPPPQTFPISKLDR